MRVRDFEPDAALRCDKEHREKLRMGNGREGPPTAKTVLLDASAIFPEEIMWLWPGFIAKRKLQLLAGLPEAGKTTLALSFVATVSAGLYWPDGTKALQGNCLVWTSEDGVEDTIIPRLMRMDADLAYVKIVKAQRDADGKERPFHPSTDMASLAEAAKAIPGGVVLTMIDPITAALNAKTDSHKEAETRNSLQPIIDFAEATGSAIIGIAHFVKNSEGKNPLQRITGSGAFGGVARLVILAAKNENEGPARIMTRAKSNIGPSGGGWGYDIDAAPLSEHPNIIATRIVWLEPLEGTARELLANAEAESKDDDSKRARAVRFLQDLLAKGSRAQTEIEAVAREQNISERTLRRAAKGLVDKKPNGFGGSWIWQLH